MLSNEIEDGALIEKIQVKCYVKKTSMFLVTYGSHGLKVKGYLVVPEMDGTCPAMIYCRGGIRRVGMVRKRKIISMAQRGYIVFAPFYRGNEGGEGREDFGGEDRHDLFNAIKLVQALEEVQSGPIPLIGFSRGAVMAMLAAKECEGIGPVVVWGGVSDLLDTYEERVDLRRMLKRVVGHPKKQIEQYVSRSPVHWAHEISAPVLIIHGTRDTQVGIGQARKLAEALERANKDYKMELYDGLEHRFSKQDDERALDAVFTWISAKRSEMMQALTSI